MDGYVWETYLLCSLYSPRRELTVVAADSQSVKQVLQTTRSTTLVVASHEPMPLHQTDIKLDLICLLIRTVPQ